MLLLSATKRPQKGSLLKLASSSSPSIFERSACTAAGLSSNFTRTSCLEARSGSPFESLATSCAGLSNIFECKAVPMQALAELLSVLPAPEQGSTRNLSPLAVPKQGRALLSKASAVFSTILGFYEVVAARSEGPEDPKRGTFEILLLLRLTIRSEALKFRSAVFSRFLCFKRF